MFYFKKMLIPKITPRHFYREVCCFLNDLFFKVPCCQQSGSLREPGLVLIFFMHGLDSVQCFLILIMLTVIEAVNKRVQGACAV